MKSRTFVGLAGVMGLVLVVVIAISNRSIPALEIGAYEPEVRVPMSKAKLRVLQWARIVRGKLFGPPESVQIEAVIMQLGDLPEGDLSALESKAGSVLEKEGMRTVVVEKADLDELRSRWEGKPGNTVVSAPKMITGDRMPGSIFMGQEIAVDGTNRSVGMEVQTKPRVRGRIVDLGMNAMFSELVTNRVGGEEAETNGLSIRTNFAFSGRALLEKGKALLVVTKPRGAGTNWHAVILSAKVLER